VRRVVQDVQLVQSQLTKSIIVINLVIKYNFNFVLNF